jgi:two-component system nitrate/nitrite response regulator NarL
MTGEGIDRLSISVIIADACPGFVEGIAWGLRLYGFRVVACCTDGPAALTAIAEHRPDIALLDLRLLLRDSRAVLKEVVGMRVGTVVVVCMTVTQAPQYRSLGKLEPYGYVSKGSSVEEIGAAVRRVADGGSCVSPELQGILLMRQADLTARELEVVGLVADGLTDKAIGVRLFISRETVRSTLDRCSDKLGVRGRAAIVAAALRRGLLD